MTVREIPPADWRAFLEEFSRLHRAWLTVVDPGSSGWASLPRRGERPLRSVTPAVQGTRVVGIDIRFQEDSAPREAVHIEAPVRIRVEETQEGTARALEILDADGESTRIRFRGAPRPEMLDGVAPGELPSE